jgi:hypothetical protein
MQAPFLVLEDHDPGLENTIDPYQLKLTAQTKLRTSNLHYLNQPNVWISRERYKRHLPTWSCLENTHLTNYGELGQPVARLDRHFAFPIHLLAFAISRKIDAQQSKR